MEFLASEIAEMVGGTLSGPDCTVHGAAIDSRILQKGQLFVPVEAARDGHEFIGAAFANGAPATFTTGLIVEGGTSIVVDDCQAALQTLARKVRPRLGDKVAGITGSVGKTSTKDLVAAVLSRRWVTTANEKSFNNELGVPLTLVNAASDTEATIVEMGARGFGHIADLCHIAQPTAAVITAVELAHSELLGSVENIAQAKGELVEALPASGVAILNADYNSVAAMAGRTSARTIMFGVNRGDVRATNISVGDDLRARFELQSDWGTAPVVLGVRGAHHVANALAAASLALVWDVPLDDVVDGLAAGQLSPWRMELHRTENGAHIINDSYNAGPASMEAALRALSHLPAERYVAVLGLMAELGEFSQESHLRIAAVAKELGIELIAYQTNEYGVAPMQTFDEIIDRLGALNSNDAVLVKGSRVAGLEVLATRLTGSTK